MQRWFEVEIQQKGVQPNAQLLVIMNRAAIRGLDGGEREASIRNYVELAHHIGEDVYAEVMNSQDYDDAEFSILDEAASEFYEDTLPTSEQAHGTDTAMADSQEVFHREDVLPIEDVPEVLSTQQQGLGLESIKKTLGAFIKLPALPADAPLDAQLARSLERQRLMEQTTVDTAIERWRSSDEDLRRIGIHTSLQAKPVGALMWQWYSALLAALEKELEEVKIALSTRSSEDDRLHYGPYLELLPLTKVAATTILFTMSTLTGAKDRPDEKVEHEMKLGALTMGLGKAIEQEAALHLVAQKSHRKDKRLTARGRQRALATFRKAARESQKAVPKGGPSQDGITASLLAWPTGVKVKLGAMLVSSLIETAQLPVTREHPRTKQKITQLQPAFMHRVRYRRGKRIGLLKPNPALVHKIESEPLGSILAKRMPMVVEPKPWTGWEEGGYYHFPNAILRVGRSGDKSGRDYFMAAHNKGNMEQVYAGLNALGKVPWQINHEVFKVQVEAWNSGEAIANFAPLHPRLELPREPEPSADPNPRLKWLQEVRDVEDKKSGMHSQRCFQNFQLEIARSLVNETIYFPHNMDFRGRAYPIPPYLNHMGADNARALLVFREGKELGVEGLRWLKIHLANVAGHDKASLQEREDYAMSHLDDIADSARNPLNGRRWWLKSEDAWQTLAACCELIKALDCPDPTKFVSHLPIHQDGTCNGLQHYAALGGDEAGAAQVNLEPGSRPADIYAGVANAVVAEVEKDAAHGNPIAQALSGRITRKVVKQPVMTNVYGVTFYGAKLQVKRQIEEMFPELRRFDAVNHANMSEYIATKIFKCLGSMFTGAQAIQHWLGQCADRISTCLTAEQVKQLTSTDGEQAPVAAKGKKDKSVSSTPNQVPDTLPAVRRLFKSTVVWTTPLRLPVVQPYRSSKAQTVVTNLQRLAIQEPQVWDPVSRKKQLQAFPPNFIHSLDATHMLLSALRCNEKGVTFASIHDSFWTHACDISRMSGSLRDAFVAMHSDDIIGRLREEFEMRYRGCMYLATLHAKSRVGRKIKSLRKELRAQGGLRGSSAELALEAERVRLLGSDDAEERKRGEEMVTPASILEAEGDDCTFAAPTEMVGQGLGEIPEAEEEAIASAQDEMAEEEGVVGGSVLATDTEALAESSSAAGQLEPAEEGPVKPLAKEDKRKGKPAVAKTSVWLPLRFPEVPAKGSFDVRRLRQSTYFFH